MSRTQVQLLFNRFIESGEYTNDNACFGSPRTSKTHENIKAVKKAIMYNHRITIFKDVLGASKE